MFWIRFSAMSAMWSAARALDDDAVRAAAALQEALHERLYSSIRGATRAVAVVGRQDHEHRPLRHRPEEPPIGLEQRLDERVRAAVRREPAGRRLQCRPVGRRLDPIPDLPPGGDEHDLVLRGSVSKNVFSPARKWFSICAIAVLESTSSTMRIGALPSAARVTSRLVPFSTTWKSAAVRSRTGEPPRLR